MAQGDLPEGRGRRITFPRARFPTESAGAESRRMNSALLRLAGVARRRDGGALDVVAGERSRDEAGRLHLFDKVAQISCPRFAATRRAHRLIDHHEPALETAQSGNAPGIGLELLLHARADFELLRDE